MRTSTILLIVTALLSVVSVASQPRKNESPTVPVVHIDATADASLVEGEQRFRANCGRCHAAPQKFPPRMMATIVRHMRVRAMITDQDMKLILHYMTQ